MRDFKGDITLNEEDCINDLLILAKSLVKLYATTLTESVSKCSRDAVRENLNGAVEDQIDLYFLLTELDYERVESAKEEQKISVRVNFAKAKKDLEINL